jgi:hypothetical protein
MHRQRLPFIRRSQSRLSLQTIRQHRLRRIADNERLQTLSDPEQCASFLQLESLVSIALTQGRHAETLHCRPMPKTSSLFQSSLLEQG